MTLICMAIIGVALFLAFYAGAAVAIWLGDWFGSLRRLL